MQNQSSANSTGVLKSQESNQNPSSEQTNATEPVGQAWKIWERVPNAIAIASGLRDIPAHWSLVPLQDKAPKRMGWEDEPFIPHSQIAEAILKGSEKISQKSGKPYRAYQSGFGLRTGDVSGGLLAIDIDGPAAGELLSAIASNHVPKTVSWTSGKTGRCQLLFQIPEKIREHLKNFTRKPIREWNGLKADCDLDFRYNRVQSCLPPSRHPETGGYGWIHSPVDTPVALAPDWLCDLLVKLANQELLESEAKTSEQLVREREQRRLHRQALNLIGETDLSEILEREILPRLGLEDIYNWSGHHFKKQGAKLVGFCPRHDSNSGTAFQINPNSLEWYCHGCAAGGHAVQYRYFADGNNGTPTGKDFIKIVEDLALLANVQLPEWKPAPEPSKEREPNARDYIAYSSWLEQEELAAEYQAKERQRQKEENQRTWQQNYATRVSLEWLRLKSITQISKEIAQQYLNVDLDRDILPGIIGVKSGMGTGKTEFLKQMVAKYERGNVISYRNSLLQNTTGRIAGIDFIWDLETGDEALNKTYRRASNWTAACIDSIAKLQPKEVLVLEEAQKLINHLLRGNTCKHHRAFILKRFQEFCQKASYIFLLDADLTDIELQYIQSIAPAHKIWTIRNNFIPHQWDIFWYVGSLTAPDEDGEEPQEKPNDRKALEARILNSIAAGEIPLIVSDSQQWLEAIERLLLMLHPDKKGLRVDSFTKADNPQTINQFLTSPNLWLKNYQPSWVLLSPTAEASLDITENWFTTVYGMFLGNIDCYSMRQMLGRYRRPVPRHIFCKTFSRRDNQSNNSPIAKVCGKHLHRYEMATLEQIALDSHFKELAKDNADFFTLLQALNEIVDAESETWKDPHLQAWTNYQARDNYQKANLRVTLQELLEEAGHRIVQEVLQVCGSTGVSKMKKSLLKERARRIAESPDISIEDARRILEDMTATSEARFMAEKALLKERLPGVELTPDFVFWCKFEERGILSALQNYWMLQHPGCREYLDREAFQKALQYNTPLWDIHTRSLELDVLRELDLSGFGDFFMPLEWTADDEEVQALKQRAIAIGSRLRLALGISATATSDPIYLLRRCLDKLGYHLQGQQRRVAGGQRQRFYKVIAPEFDPNRAAVLAAYERYFEEVLPHVKDSAQKQYSEASQGVYQWEFYSDCQAVTPEYLAAELAPQQAQAPRWRGLLVKVRESVDISFEWEKALMEKLPREVLEVVEEPFKGLNSSDWRVWCKYSQGIVVVPCNWLEATG